MQGESMISCEPAKLGSGEERPEGFTHAVSAPVERPAHERPEEVPVLGGHEGRAALGGHREASVYFRLRMEGVRRQLKTRRERIPWAPAQGVFRVVGANRACFSATSVCTSKYADCRGAVGSSRRRCRMEVVTLNGMFATTT
jgi:hypothetical protein